MQKLIFNYLNFKAMNDKVYQIVTDRIIKTIEENGKLPWVKPWKHSGVNPSNGVTKRPYEGINFFLLANAPYANPYYLTYKQATELGGNVKKGEHGWPVVFWKVGEYEKEGKDGKLETKNSFLLRYYTVFNVEQCEGEKLPQAPKITDGFKHDPIAEAEAIIKGYPKPPTMTVKPSERAYYTPSLDSVTMPELKQFISPNAFYCTFFHELGHSTGHSSRLNRKELTGHNPFGSHDYGVEELTAELTAAFLCAECGISNDDLLHNNAAYLKNWITAIREDHKLFVTAAGKAGKAAKHILGTTEPEGQDEPQPAKREPLPETKMSQAQFEFLAR